MIEAESESTGNHERLQQQEFLNKALTTLDLLDERAEKVGVRLEQIEARMIKLGKQEEEEAGKKKDDPPGEGQGPTKQAEDGADASWGKRCSCLASSVSSRLRAGQAWRRSKQIMMGC